MLIDLRSDTVTKPTPEMRRAMAEAEVGDDVYNEDPTVNWLEARAAEIFGKQAAVYVPSGCMGNTLGVKVHTRHGEEIICESRSHVMNYELAMAGWFAGCLCRTIIAEDGILTWKQIQPQIKKVSPHWSPTGLISLENTHNMAGGTVTPKAVLDEICDGAHDAGLPVHLDGARVFNAATALGLPVGELTAQCDTVMFCLSKGLGAPVGSMLVGAADVIDRARLYRKRLGGAMRQAGVLAAAGLIALEKMPARLSEDHSNALLIAKGLARVPGVRIDASRVVTNIAIADISGTGLSAGDFVQALKDRKVLVNSVSETSIRFVTHYDVSRSQCETALAATADAAESALIRR